MNLLVALAVSITVLVIGWVYVSLGIPGLGLVVWAGVIGWGSFYAAGGGLDGAKKAILGNLSGAIWAFIALAAFGLVGGGIPVLAVIFGLAAGMMVLQAKIPLLGFIPGAFFGAATWVGADGGGAISDKGAMILASLVIGAVLGYVSEAIGKKMAKA